MNGETIAAIIIAILGSGGLGAVITSILSARKYKAEADQMEQENEKARRSFEQDMNEKLNKQFAELAEIHKNEAETQREQSKILEKEVADLKKQVVLLMSWIMTEDASYRLFLENKIRETEPDFVFPKLKPIPGMDPDLMKSLGLEDIQNV
jgi:uncharacterized protein HemX